MEPFCGHGALVAGFRQPMLPPRAVLASGDLAGPGRHRMQDRPQDHLIRCRAAVRPVQHHQLPFDDQSIGHLPVAVMGKTEVVFPC